MQWGARRSPGPAPEVVQSPYTMIPVLYQDDDVIAVDKPAGLPVVPAGGEPPAHCVRRLLEAQLGQALWVVHRLDRQTSGVLVFARTADAHRRLNGLFERRAVQKIYTAFTAGVPDPEAGLIDVPLHVARRGRMRPCLPGEPGVAAATDYRVTGAWRRGEHTAARVQVRPCTGRHHQIRVHLRSRGTPILFDDVYGRVTLSGEWNRSPCRHQALHAERLDLPIGGGGDPLRIESPPRAELAALVGWFETEWEVCPTHAAAEGQPTSWPL